MNDVHGAHGTAGIVENPLLVEVDVLGDGGAVLQLVDNVLDDGAGVVAVRRDSSLGHIVEVVRLKDVEGVEVLLKQVDDGREDADQDGEELENAPDAAR